MVRTNEGVLDEPVGEVFVESVGVVGEMSKCNEFFLQGPVEAFVHCIVGRGVLSAPPITEFVLLEVGNALSGSARGRDRFLTLLDRLRNSRAVKIVPASSDLFAQGIERYRLRPDKTWSVIDCISFVLMEQMGLTDALTADRHFEQAGFTVLLK